MYDKADQIIYSLYDESNVRREEEEEDEHGEQEGAWSAEDEATGQDAPGETEPT